MPRKKFIIKQLHDKRIIIRYPVGEMFIAVFFKNSCHFGFGATVDYVGGPDPAASIHPHVERAV